MTWLSSRIRVSFLAELFVVAALGIEQRR